MKTSRMAVVVALLLVGTSAFAQTAAATPQPGNIRRGGITKQRCRSRAGSRNLICPLEP